MGIFSIKTGKTTRQEKMIGSYLDKDTHSYLSLYTISNQINKSNLLRDLIQKWYDKTMQKWTRGELIEDLGKKAQEEWGRRWDSYYYMTKGKREAFALFCEELTKNLRQKGVSDDDITKILKKVRE